MNNWYQRVREEIEAQYGDDADLFCNLLAACSPRKQVQANWNLADRVYKSRGSFRLLRTVRTLNWLRNLGVMSSQVPNVIRALNGEELSGPKVRAFAANLKGDMSQVTVDVWMLKLFGFEKPSVPARAEVIDYVIKAAEEMGCEPAEMQAEMWEFSVRGAGREPKSFVAAAVKQRQIKFDWGV